MGTAALLITALVAVAVLLVLVIRLELPAFLALLLVSMGTAVVTGINDSGFWIVTKYLGLSVADGLKTWTTLTTVCGVAGFLLTWALWLAI